MSRSAKPNRHDTIAREAYDGQWRTSQFATRARLPRGDRTLPLHSLLRHTAKPPACRYRSENGRSER